MIGDLVYDPVADNYIELIDILSRQSTRLGHGLVRLPAGRFGPGLPQQDLLLSPKQPVGYPDRSPASAPTRLEFKAACRLGEEYRDSALLFALFSERPGCISVGGLVLQVFDTRSLNQPVGSTRSDGIVAPAHAGSMDPSGPTRRRTE
ncbi:hypothetical protein [Szabonella alba]|uniref:Uncharacterized protein n=1 Tax=Szabonella alba TaxID=2804194 RepID=A0A8K0VFW7_9RHOB|nr:hypothetical protein [Szabonella alba]MBL4919040.1 hypothetical protein [Szabonella alba]